MRVSLVVAVAAIPLVFSCGPADEPMEGAGDATRSVSGETLEAAPVEAAPSEPPAAASALRFDGFVGGSRFAVLEEDAETTIVDLVTRRVAVVKGRPIADEGFGGELAQFDVAPSVPTRVARATKDGRRLLVVDDEGAYLVDTATGARVVSLPGATDDAELGDGDAMLVAWGGETMRFADPDGAWKAEVPLRTDDATRVSFLGRLVVVHGRDGERLIDRATWTEWPIPTGKLLRVTAGGLALVQSGDVLALYQVGEDAAPERFAGVPEEAEVYVDDAHVAWGERNRDDDGPVTFHVVSRATLAASTFRGAGHCSIQPEAIVSISGGEITTDVTCNPGCASIPYQEQRIVYDATTGSMRRRVDGEVSPPVTLAWDATLDRLAIQTARLGQSRTTAIESPGAPGVFAWATATEVRLGDGLRGRVLRAMQHSAGASRPVFSSDGRFLAAFTSAGAGLSIWDVRTGERVHATGAAK
jgi:hypothetical protein